MRFSLLLVGFVDFVDSCILLVEALTHCAYLFFVRILQITDVPVFFLYPVLQLCVLKFPALQNTAHFAEIP